MNEKAFNNKETREEMINNVSTLDKVKDLILLPNTDYATIEQVASYYEVGLQAIESIVLRHRKELDSDGFELFRKSNVVSLLDIPDGCLESVVGKSIATLEDGVNIDIPNRGLRLFPKRAILRTGMLLRDSRVAKEVRTRLLDVEHDTQKESPEIIKSVVDEINEEKQLLIQRVEAEMNGDYDEVSVVNAKLFGLKNKRIAQLEEENYIITNNSLTITESRKVINCIARAVASSTDRYRHQYAQVWQELYRKANYKLGINIKARGKTEGSYLGSLSEEETFKLERIVRAWAVDLGLDLDYILKLS